MKTQVKRAKYELIKILNTCEAFRISGNRHHQHSQCFDLKAVKVMEPSY